MTRDKYGIMTLLSPDGNVFFYFRPGIDGKEIRRISTSVCRAGKIGGLKPSMRKINTIKTNTISLYQ
jgi:hypothetical protein